MSVVLVASEVSPGQETDPRRESTTMSRITTNVAGLVDLTPAEALAANGGFSFGDLRSIPGLSAIGQYVGGKAGGFLGGWLGGALDGSAGKSLGSTVGNLLGSFFGKLL